MAEIRVLPQNVADKIAAGEVCERPASVCKELLENSIDAGADKITVEIKNGGIKYIRVTDNGCGIEGEFAETAFLRHATSKLRQIDDLDGLETMGFRGEALASICAVARVELISKTKEAELGVYLVMEGGKPSEKTEIACADGTTLIVEDLFSNIPARMKFMKKDSTEAGYVADVIGRIALSRPDISIELISDGKEVFKTIGDGDISNTVLKIYGIECAKALCRVDYERDGIKIKGVVGKPEISRGNRTRQTLFVNERYVKNHVVSKIVEEAYKNAVMTGRFPFFVIGIYVSPKLVDVNVHPAKTEVKFAYEKEVYDAVYYAVKAALYTDDGANGLKYAKRDALKNGEGISDKTDKTDKTTSHSFIPPAPVQMSMSFRKIGGSVLKETPVTKQEYNNLKSEIPSAGDMKNFTEKYIEYTTPPAELEKQTKEIENRAKDIEISGTSEAAENTENIENVENIENIEQEKIEIECGERAEKKILGQVFDTYIIYQQGESVFFVDQHAAHERARFEMLLEQKRKSRIFSQKLLVPIVLDLDPAERMIVTDNAEFFEEYGFETGDFGGGSIVIQSAPAIGSDRSNRTDRYDKEIKSLVFEIIDILKNEKKGSRLTQEERTLDTIACKYAIKANKKLTLPETESLLEEVEALEKRGITTCPHGRPIKTEITKYEMEKMFKRIV